jgi:hypothetical protein
VATKIKQTNKKNNKVGVLGVVQLLIYKVIQSHGLQLEVLVLKEQEKEHHLLHKRLLKKRL